MIEDHGPKLDLSLALPEEAHLPGRNQRPQSGIVFDVAAAAPERMTRRDWETNTAYLYGFALYRAGFYWEAHEVWEPVWQSCQPNAPEKLLLQALIQITNARLKERLNRPRAAHRLIHHAEALLGEVLTRDVATADGEPLLGVNVGALHQLVGSKVRSKRH